MEQILEQIEIIYINKTKVLHINKVSSIIGVDIIEDMEIAEVTPKNVRSTFS